MSYCRFGPDSDVYVFPDIGGGFNCSDNGHGRGFRGVNLRTRSEVLEWLAARRAEGLAVPADAEERLREELAAERER